jgi:hypothetical protein
VTPCLVADQLRACTKTFESTGEENKKGIWIPLDKIILVIYKYKNFVNDL